MQHFALLTLAALAFTSITGKEIETKKLGSAMIGNNEQGTRNRNKK